MKMTIPQHKVVASHWHMEFSIHGSDAPGISEICEERGYAWDQQDIYAIFDLIDNMEIKVIFHD